MRLLCLSNGHGEDRIAAAVLQALQERSGQVDLEALPLVGMGQAYRNLGIPIFGPVQYMPSGGFVYMDARQLTKDVRAGLLTLSWQQWQAIRAWVRKAPPQSYILAVGDIWPLLLAWGSGAPYLFVATARSEYYVRDEAGPLVRRRWYQWLEGYGSSVFQPWERWLMSRKRCRAVFVRDSLTAGRLNRAAISVHDCGNPMMDNLAPQGVLDLTACANSLIILLLPGSREPEAYSNWTHILRALPSILEAVPRQSVQFLAALAPGLDAEVFAAAVRAQGWPPRSSVLAGEPGLSFGYGDVTLTLIAQGFNDALHGADLGIALAGTATEQLVGLGKPVITFPGAGPQFTARFAEAQQRLLGPSVRLIDRPEQAGRALAELLRDPDLLQAIAQNGRRRMGTTGAAGRIAQVIETLFGR